MVLLAPRDGSAHDTRLAEVLAFHQDLIEREYDIQGLRDGSALAPSSIRERNLTREWFARAQFKLFSNHQRIAFLLRKLERLFSENPNPYHISPEKIKTLYQIIAPFSDFYFNLKQQKNDLRRYYEKKLAEQQRNLLSRIQLRRYVRMLKDYNERVIPELENQLEYFHSVLKVYTEGLSNPRLPRIESVCTQIAPSHKEALQECTICYEDVQEAQDDTEDPQATGLWLPCQHGFHKNCILPWLHTHNTCPTCRQEVLTAG